MNLNATNLTIAPCVVCGYMFSDQHHIWPQAKGGTKLPTVTLCPNHHRYANIMQAMLMQHRSREEITQFALQHFDERFNTAMLTFLIDEQQRLSKKGWIRLYTGLIMDAAKRGEMGEARAAWLAMFPIIFSPDDHAAGFDRLERWDFSGLPDLTPDALLAIILNLPHLARARAIAEEAEK